MTATERVRDILIRDCDDATIAEVCAIIDAELDAKDAEIARLTAEMERLRMFEAMHIARDMWLDAGPASDIEDKKWMAYLRARADYEKRYGAVR